MSVTICPTITAETPEEYKHQMEVVEPYAKRIHVDITDGDFAVRKLIRFDQIWWRGNRTVDLHVMYRRPVEHTDIILALKPRLVIVQAESEGNFEWFAAQLHKEGIEVGVALMQRTPVETILPALEHIEHVLIFSGNLGFQGGSEADLGLLKKAEKIKEAKPSIELGWDGGVNDQNVRTIAEGGIEVINAGGYIHGSPNPQAAFYRLEDLVKGV